MSKAIYDNSDVTSNSAQIEILKKHFPECFDKQGKFIYDKLQEIVANSGTEFSKESYRLNWLGKSYARLLANENPLTFLSEDRTHNQKPDNQNSENLLIKGDNLEVLKHLKHAYYDQIKVIYIDPPYNTGSDGFVYQDNRQFTADELSQLAGIDLDEAQRILDFTQSKANSHSAWLTFMYPRLYVARELLKDDGVIFISIDDNEVAQLRLLCDEIFGEEHFVALFVWKSRQNKDNRSVNGASIDHEYVLCYGNSIRGAERNLSGYANPDNDPKGDWTSSNMVGLATADRRPNLHYDLINPATGDNYGCPKMGWRYDNSTMNRLIEEGLILWPTSLDGRPRKKAYLSELTSDYTGCSSIIGKDIYTRNGTADILNLFGERVMDFPKPIEFIKEIILQANPKEDIILDFFAGSATTAHAVMELNAQDNGKRKYIMVQIPEPCDKKSEAYKAGYTTIFDIAQARIEKAADKIKLDHPDYAGDLGFKIFATVSVPDGYLADIKELNSTQTDLFDGSRLDEKQLEDLLTTWKVYDGIPLTAVLTPVDLAGYTAFRQDPILYLVHQGFSTSSLVVLLQKLDDIEQDKTFDIERLVLFAHNFSSKHQREIKEGITQYQNRKGKSMSVEFRY